LAAVLAVIVGSVKITASKKILMSMEDVLLLIFLTQCKYSNSLVHARYRLGLLPRTVAVGWLLKDITLLMPSWDSLNFQPHPIEPLDIWLFIGLIY
jgi:hypothetical protein